MFQAMPRYITAVVLAFLLSGSERALALGPADSGDLPPTDLERIQLGEPAPDFSLEDEKGATLSLSQFRDQKNVVLVFYRGHW